MKNKIQKLSEWLQTDPQNGGGNKELRVILGELLESVNKASELFKTSVRNPSTEISAMAQGLLRDIEQYPILKTLLPQVEQKAKSLNANPAIVNMIHTLEHSNFSQRHIGELRTIASNSSNLRRAGFVDESDPEGLQKHLRASIYDLKNEGGRTLKAIREILQNAVDASDPKKHPEVTNPVIKLTYHSYGHNEYIDLIAEDHGIGMNWDVLSKKFFVLFQTGKTGAEAGGFGIAKALIQDTPKHGWSIETNPESHPPIHASRFHKNLYFGTRQEEGYTPPTSKIKKTSQGTTLSLYGLPYVYEYQIEELCAIYATNGRVTIFLNNKQIKPKFTLDAPDVRPLTDLNNVVGAVGDSDAAKILFDKDFRDRLANDLSPLEYAIDPRQTKVEFYVRGTNSSYGNLYVMLNGQFQYSESVYLNKLDLICAIETTARPGDTEYPLDPGRDHVRGKVAEQLTKVLDSIKDFTSKLGEDELFKDGIDLLTLNPDAKPMSTYDDDIEIISRKNQLEDALFADLTQATTAPPEERIKQQVQRVLGKRISKVQDAVISSMAKEMKTANDRITIQDHKELREKIAALVEELTSPANIMVQKNFVKKDFISSPENIGLTTAMMILWQKTLKILMDQLGQNTKYTAGINRAKFVPGLIFSDECLGVYVPKKPDLGRPYDTVAVNPITLAASINPKAFNDKMNPKPTDAFSTIPTRETDEDSDSDDDGPNVRGGGDTPINRVTKFLFHVGVHELCHQLHPDAWGSESFHKHITLMEILCHDSFHQIRAEVKSRMKKLKSNSSSLITLMAKHRKKFGLQQESLLFHGIQNFDEWLRQRRG